MKIIQYSLAGLAGAVLAFAASVLAFSVIPAPLAQFPLEYVADTFPQGTEVCPGDTVYYNLAILEQVEGPVALYSTIDRAPHHPAVLEVQKTELAQALISEYGIGMVGDTVLFDESPAWAILGGDDQPGEGLRVDIDSSFVIPENLGPGPYIRKLAVVWEGRPASAAIRIQRFTVKDGCQ